ncbi:MAG: DUF2934 domain-containing protein [Vicinamibacterales bacterium]
MAKKRRDKQIASSGGGLPDAAASSLTPQPEASSNGRPAQWPDEDREQPNSGRTAGGTVVGPADGADDLNRRIASRAYERFLARGCEHGHDQEDWLLAEEDCRQQRHH